MGLKNRRRGQSQFGVGFSPNSHLGGTKRHGNKRRNIAGPVIVACAVVAVLVAADYLMNSDRIYRGVEVGDVALGGKTPAEARQIVEEHATGALEEIEFSGPERFTRTASEMGVKFNIEATVDDAYAVGRQGNILERLGERANALLGGVTIPPDVDYVPGKAQAEVEEIASQVNHEPRDASVNIYGSEVEVVESHEGYKLDFPVTMQNVDSAIDDMSGKVELQGRVLKPAITTQEAEVAAEKARRAVSEQLVFRAEGKTWTLSPSDIGSALTVTKKNGEIDIGLDRDRLVDRLANVYNDLTVRPIEARYDFARSGSIIVTQSKNGQRIEEDKFLSAIENGLFAGRREYEVPITVDEPQYTTAELEPLKPTKLLGTYKTNYEATTDQGQTRVENLKIASNAISGTFLAPGEVFSMNDTVSHLHYYETHVIINGAETTADGGGLCQVTSTLYNAVLYAGLEVTERHPHYSQLPYIRPGMDATVWYGDLNTTTDDLDMKFKNTTDGFVLLREYVSSDGYIYANVYGVPDNVDVVMWSKKVWMTPDASEWVTYYKRSKNGKVVYQDKWNTEYGALIDDEANKIPTPQVPIAEIDGTYLGPAF